jgi:integrase/recombinase XerD
MMAAVESYLAVRRAAGYTLSNTGYLLRSFAIFAADQEQTHIHTATAIKWASQAGSVAQRHTRYQTICRFAQYLRVEDPRHELPPANHFGYRKTRRIPRIYSRDEIASLVLAATRLSSSDSLLPKTYAALISLLAATGLRISEALHLLVADITPTGLLIRRTKFQKTRLVPLHETAVTGLGHYLMIRQEARRGGDHVFVSDEGTPLVYWKVHSVFRSLLKSAGIKPSGSRWPRIHELRHHADILVMPTSCAQLAQSRLRTLLRFGIITGSSVRQPLAGEPMSSGWILMDARHQAFTEQPRKARNQRLSRSKRGVGKRLSRIRILFSESLGRSECTSGLCRISLMS